MKYYFTPYCYWDNDKECIYRNSEIIAITSSQAKIMKKLISNNGKFVSHDELYLAMTGLDPIGEYKSALSNQFTRNKPNEKGILIRVPEIEPYYESSKRRSGGGYKLSIPQENIHDENEIDGIPEQFTSIWWDNAYLAKESTRPINNISRSMNKFLNGGNCYWSLLLSSNDAPPVRRDVIDDIKALITDEYNIIVLNGAGGEGKTTILMQTCAELYKEGKKILYHVPTYKYDLPDNASDYVLFVDSPMSERSFREFLSYGHI